MWRSPKARSRMCPALSQWSVCRMPTGPRPPLGAAEQTASRLAQTLQLGLICYASLHLARGLFKGLRRTRTSTASLVAEMC
jgi:hypothetical protein